jgi:hypothetical protein
MAGRSGQRGQGREADRRSGVTAALERQEVRARLANPAGFSVNHLSELFSVRCLSAANCIAAGEAGTNPDTSSNLIRNEAFHWNGKRWSLVRTPNPGGTGAGDSSEISAPPCGSRTSCWRAGSASSGQPVQKSVDQILRWNGKKWTHVFTRWVGEHAGQREMERDGTQWTATWV